MRAPAARAQRARPAEPYATCLTDAERAIAQAAAGAVSTHAAPQFGLIARSTGRMRRSVSAQKRA